MTDKQELIERLQAGIRDLTTSERWEMWLRMQRRFHRYSWGNSLLIALARPDATHVAGFHTWKSLGRSVRKGEKGIAIIAPVIRRTRVEDEEGNVTMMTGSPSAFRVAYVFDIAQTEGEAFSPAPVSRLSGDDPGNVYDTLHSTATAIGYTVELSEFTNPDKNGDCRFEPKIIRLRDGLSPAQMCKTLAHELAHALLHGGHDCTGIRAVAELEAESVAYIVCAELQIDSSAYSLGYVATWAGGGDEAVKGISQSAQRIATAARRILAGGIANDRTGEAA